MFSSTSPAAISTLCCPRSQCMRKCRRTAARSAHVTVQRLPENGAWRVTIQVKPAGDQAGRSAVLSRFVRRSFDRDMDLSVDTVRNVAVDHNRVVRRAARWRRALFFGLTLLTAGAATAMMCDILAANGLTGLKRAGLVLFYILFIWITGAFWTALAGFVIRLRGGDPVALKPQEVAGRPLRRPYRHRRCRSTTRTPRASWRVSMSSGRRCAAAGAARRLISSFFPTRASSRSPRPRKPPGARWSRAIMRQGRIFYRRRTDNAGRKAGNIADFVRAWGGAYDYAIVLDADSIMSGEALVTLARLMDAHPQVGHHPGAAAAGGARDAVRAAHPIRRAADRARCSRAASPSGSSARATTGATTRSCG